MTAVPFRTSPAHAAPPVRNTVHVSHPKELEEGLLSNKPPFVRTALLFGILLPPFALLLAMYLAWNRGFGPVDLACWSACTSSPASITIGHRYFSHKSFDASKPMIFLLGFCGSMQGPIFWWVRPHATTSTATGPRPHSRTLRDHGRFRGFWHAHMGWLFRPSTDPVDKYIRDEASRCSAGSTATSSS